MMIIVMMAVVLLLLMMMMQVDGLVGAKEVLRTVPEKAAFLLALHPKDRMRLLGMASTACDLIQISQQAVTVAICYARSCLNLFWHYVSVKFHMQKPGHY